MKTQFSFAALLVAVLLSTSAFAGVTELKPLKTTVPIGNVQSGEYTRVPGIDWGGEYDFVFANGNSVRTIASSIFGRLGLKLEYWRENNPQKMLNAYMSGETPYFRGTYDMVEDVLPQMMQDPRTEPVLIFVKTRSTGGDALGVTKGIKTVADLRGRKVALQAHGPHMSFNYTLLKLAKLSPRDLTIVWTKGLSEPAELVRQGKADAAYGIFPDIDTLENGDAGDRVAGFRNMMSTKTYDKVIFDVYVVRRDYFDAHKSDVYNFVMGLLQSQDKLVELFKKPGSPEFKKTVQAFADIVLGGEFDVKTAQDMILDFTFARFSFNETFFTGTQFPNVKTVGKQIKEALAAYGLPTHSGTIATAGWDYARLRSGGSLQVQAERAMFKPQAVEAVVKQRQAQGTIADGEIFPSVTIHFKVKQTTFPASTYAMSFDETIAFLEKMGGAVVVIEGHADPSYLLHQEKKGAPDSALRKIKQAAFKLSRQRAVSVMRSIIDYASGKGIVLDQSQFTVTGVGFDSPVIAVPRSRAEAEQNMRVVFRIMALEAEADIWAN